MSDDKRVLVVAEIIPTDDDSLRISPTGIVAQLTRGLPVSKGRVIDPQADDFPPPELVEKVARAIARREALADQSIPHDHVDEEVDGTWYMFKPEAKAAIDAVMEWAVGRG